MTPLPAQVDSSLLHRAEGWKKDDEMIQSSRLWVQESPEVATRLTDEQLLNDEDDEKYFAKREEFGTVAMDFKNTVG